MKRIPAGLILTAFLLASCSSAVPATVSEPLTVQYTFAATAWLTDLEPCAGGTVVQAEPRAAEYLDPGNANLILRIGPPAGLTFPAYQIGTEELLVIVNRQNPIDKLTSAQVEGLFSGRVGTWKDINQKDAPVTVWVFPSGEDVQQLFGQAVLNGAPVSSLARLATSPDEMSRAVAADVNAIGLLPRHWKAGNVSAVFTAATAPVLAIVPSRPDGAMAEILACLQK